MITGELKSKIDRIWEAFWSGGISNPLTVIEQITYLLFIRRLDEIHSNREKKANFTGKPIENPIFTDRNQHFRWSRFRDFDPERMHKVILTEVFPFIKTFHDNGESSYTKFMADAIFIIPTPALLDKVVGMLDDIPMENRDTKGDLYEYLLSKLNTAGQNGQFRTPRHIIRMMVDITAPKTDEIICDPASGTCGFLMSANEYVREHYKANFSKKGFLDHYNNKMFTAFDFDSTMLRIGAMNMLLHGIENPHIENRDSLSQEADFEEAFTLILANPPFKGSLDYDSVAKNLLQVVKTKKTELLFLALFIRLLKTGGRCACIVPDGVLFGSSNAHKQLRKILVDDQKLDAVISMPSGVFKPYAGVSTAVLIFTKTNSGGTDNVWFYDMKADGFSLDDKRTALDTDKHTDNNIPDIVSRWHKLKDEVGRKRTDQSFTVPAKEIQDNGYDLSINRYKEIVYKEVKYDPPEVIIAELEELEKRSLIGLGELKGMLK